MEDKSMQEKIIDGKALAARMREEIREETSRLAHRGTTPGLGVVLVGEDPASQSYVRGKEKACGKAGIYSENIRLPEETSQEELLRVVDRLNRDEKIHGILVQLPLPNHIDSDAVIEAIRPEKDVDGFHPVNVGRMVLGREAYLPCTPHGILKMIETTGMEIQGKEVVILGRSNIVGKPLANMLIQKGPQGNATVTVCHTRTADTAAHTRRADIVVAAAGRPGTLTAEMVKEGAVVIDVGVNRVEDASRKRGYRLVGDADYEGLLPKVSAITPVPGGVGPMTITMLLDNTLEAARRTADRQDT